MKNLFYSLIFFTSIATATAAPLNILILYADDWRHDTLSCAGNPVVQTPRLDQLASEGLRFTRNHVTTAVCGVSRSNLLTGQWMSRNGCTGFDMFTTPWEATYPGLLRTHGYHVGHIGKWHNGKFPAQRYDFARPYHGKHWYKDANGQPIHVTQRNENDALEFLKTRPQDKPFCLTLAFFATHAEDAHPDQFLPQPQSMALYQDLTIPTPSNATEESWKRLPSFFNEKNEGRRRWHWRFDTPEKYQRMMKNYYRLATEVDSTCGRIIDALKKQGLLENTLIIFTTDNGYYHAEHGLADKWYPHQESIRVPLLIRDPRMPKAKHGTTDEALTLSVDLAPTILAAAQLPIPKSMQGENIAPLYLDEIKPQWRTDYFYEHPCIRHADFIPSSEALVQQDWKYLYWPQHKVEQLFHLKSDPHEETDLIDSPDHSETLKKLRQRFQQLKAEAQAPE